MGLVIYHRVETGMNIKGPNYFDIHLIVKEILLKGRTKTTRLEVIGSAELDEIMLSEEEDIMLEGVVQIGIVPNASDTINSIRISYKADPEYYFERGIYR